MALYLINVRNDCHILVHAKLIIHIRWSFINVFCCDVCMFAVRKTSDNASQTSYIDFKKIKKVFVYYE